MRGAGAPGSGVLRGAERPQRGDGARATSPAAGRNSRAASGGDGGGGSLLWERRNLQHHAPGDVPRAVDRKNGGRRPHRRGGGGRAQPRVHATAALRGTAIWTCASRVSSDGSLGSGVRG